MILPRPLHSIHTIHAIPVLPAIHTLHTLHTDVQAVGHDCDLAILSVEDEAFWSSPTDMLPLKLGDLPALQQDVIVVGWGWV